MTLNTDTLQTSIDAMTTEEKVAQLMVVGFEGTTITDELQWFLDRGVGGVIFFRQNLQTLSTQDDVINLTRSINQSMPSHLPKPFMAIDQEGGQIERLPSHLFPTALSPMNLGYLPIEKAKTLADEMYSTMASQLAQLGFNLNFAPTLDVNLEPTNPIIGVRAFSEHADMVNTLGTIASHCYLKHGVLPVGKHFPGHGNGTVDSHKTLPTLTFNPEEKATFSHAIQNDIPALLVSHGYYPDLQPATEINTPATLSPHVVTTVLKQELGFQGLVITDDMTMGAISAGIDADQAAIKSLQSGTHLLVYQHSHRSIQSIYHALVQAVQSGQIPEKTLNTAVQAVLNAKHLTQSQNKKPSQSQAWSPATTSLQWAHTAITTFTDTPPPLLTNESDPLLVIEPDRSTIHHYAWEADSSMNLTDSLQSAGIQTHSYQYPVHPSDKATLSIEHELDILHSVLNKATTPSQCVFVAFNANLHPYQIQLGHALLSALPSIHIHMVSASNPYDLRAFKNNPAIKSHLGLFAWRESHIKALSSLLTGIKIEIPLS